MITVARQNKRAHFWRTQCTEPNLTRFFIIPKSCLMTRAFPLRTHDGESQVLCGASIACKRHSRVAPHDTTLEHDVLLQPRAALDGDD